MEMVKSKIQKIITNQNKNNEATLIGIFLSMVFPEQICFHNFQEVNNLGDKSHSLLCKSLLFSRVPNLFCC